MASSANERRVVVQAMHVVQILVDSGEIAFLAHEYQFLGRILRNEKSFNELIQSSSPKLSLTGCFFMM